MPGLVELGIFFACTMVMLGALELKVFRKMPWIRQLAAALFLATWLSLGIGYRNWELLISFGVFFLGAEFLIKRRSWTRVLGDENLRGMIYFMLPAFTTQLIFVLVGKMGVVLPGDERYHGAPWALAKLGVPAWLQISLFVITTDLRRYWWHRMEHNVPFFWRVHKHHHSSTEMSLLANRDHPFYGFFDGILGAAHIWLMGINPALTGVALTFYFGWISFNHTGIAIPKPKDNSYPWWALIVVTPAYHSWHHTSECRYDANLADVFPIWDLIFGTFEAPRSNEETWKYGLEGDEKLPESVLMSMLTPFQGRQRPQRPETSSPLIESSLIESVNPGRLLTRLSVRPSQFPS